MSTSALTVAIVLALAAVTASSALFTVQEGRQAIVLQFGRPIGAPITEAGLHAKMPFIQDVRYFDKRMLVWDGNPNQIPTKGREFIWIDTTARWRIADALKFVESVATEEGAQSRLDDILDSVVRDHVSGSELIELVRSSTWVKPAPEVLEQATPELEQALKQEVVRGREEITRDILTAARRITPQYGIDLVDLRIKRLNYVESVREKVYTRMISERKRIAARFRSEGEGDSARIKGQMEKELLEIRSGAYRRAQETRGKADAEATQIYGAAYGRDPEFFAFTRTLDAYRDAQNPNSVLILTTDGDYYRYLKDATPPSD